MLQDIPLEDRLSDVLGKAARGLNLNAKGLAERTGLTEPSIQSALDGDVSHETLAALGPVLGLQVASLHALAAGSIKPAAVEIQGLAGFNTPFDDMTVNSFLVWDPVTREAAAFDTGADVTDMLACATQKNLVIKQIFITHSHGDHIFDLDRLKERTGAPAWTGDKEPVHGATSFQAGSSFTVGSLQIATRLTWGHCNGGITYVVSGLERPVAVVGDALVAASMGGGKISYTDALRTNRECLFSLPDNTVVCPGHGPATSIGEERRHNPFFAQ
jgi:glyoxylase-like metal-dependent hydrolase (beta-lactamase superfamily II)